MKREVHSTSYMVNSYELGYLRDKDYYKHMERRSLYELGYEYAKKYATKAILYYYRDLRDGQISGFTEEKDEKYYELQYIKYIWSLK